MIKVGIQTYKNSGHSGRGIGVYGAELVENINGIKGVEVVEFSDVSELGNVDLVHFLHFDLFQRSLDSKMKVPFMVTVHDVTPLVFAKHYPAGIRGSFHLFLQKKALKKAVKIITVSEASKKDIVKYLGIDEQKIEVIYSGVGKQFKKISDKKILQSVVEKYKLPEKFAFYSGNVNWNKNILQQTAACIEVGIDLVLVGKSFEQKIAIDHPEMKSYKQFLEAYANHPKVHILGFVPDEDLVNILNLATVALFVSFYEGFGFPILEAQACGVPVMTANVSAMPEVAGEGALLVNPDSVLEMSNGLKKILDDVDYRNDLIKKGAMNVSQFDWQKTAEKTVAVYKEVVG